VRVQAFKAEKQRKEDRERERAARQARQAHEAEAVGKLKAINAKVYNRCLWVWELLGAASRAEGVPESDYKRWGRKPELKLLLMEVKEAELTPHGTPPSCPPLRTVPCCCIWQVDELRLSSHIPSYLHSHLPSTSIRTSLHTSIRTSLHTSIRTSLHTSIRTSLRTSIRSSIRTSLRTSIRTSLPPPRVTPLHRWTRYVASRATIGRT
jgi:hypothetical protein